MKHITKKIIYAVSMAILACKTTPTESEQQEVVTGKWGTIYTKEKISVSLSMEINKGGTYTMSASFLSKNEILSRDIEIGKWHTSDNYFISEPETCQKGNPPSLFACESKIDSMRINIEHGEWKSAYIDDSGEIISVTFVRID